MIRALALLRMLGPTPAPAGTAGQAPRLAGFAAMSRAGGHGAGQLLRPADGQRLNCQTMPPGCASREAGG